MAKRARGRPAQSAVSDNALLEAVLQSFAESGYDGTSVREIARSLDVSHNLIPQRFGSKEKLWYAAVDHGFGRLIQDLTQEAERLGSDEVQVLRGLIASCIEMNALHPSMLQIINQEATQPGPRLDYLFAKYIKPIRDFGDAWLVRLAQEGRMAPVSITLLYFLITHGAGGMFALPALTSRLGGDTEELTSAGIREQAQSAVNILFDGLMVR